MITVLVIDDDPDIRTVVSDLLESEGYHVAGAADGAEGLAILSQASPELILLDMRMPGVDGWAFARAAQAQGWSTPIVVMTAAHDAHAWAAEIQAQGCLPKPFDLSALLRMVARFVPQPLAPLSGS